MRRRDYEQGVTPPYFRSAFTPRSRYAIPFFFRVRIHPFFLIIFFILGITFSRWLESDKLATPVYQGDPFWEEDYEPFLPPDAPPLNKDVDQDDRSLAARRARTKARLAVMQGFDPESETDEEENDGYSSNNLDNMLSRPSYFNQLHGYLYYPSSAPLVTIPIPAAVRSHKPSTPFDTLLDPPPIPPADERPAPPAVRPHPPLWIHPETPFKNPDNLHPDAAVPPPPVARFPDPVRAAPNDMGGRYPMRPNMGVGRPQRPAVGGPPNLILNPQRPPAQVAAAAAERRIGANAAAMIRAERDGLPFKPAKPAEILEEQREFAQQNHLRRIQEERKKAAEAREWAKGPAAAEIVLDNKVIRNAALADRRKDARLRKDQEDLERFMGAAAARDALRPVPPPAFKDLLQPPPAPLKMPPPAIDREEVVKVGEVVFPTVEEEEEIALEELDEDESEVDQDELRALTPEERAAEDEELRELFGAMSEDEKAMLTPDELAVFAELDIEKLERIAAIPAAKKVEPPVAVAVKQKKQKSNKKELDDGNKIRVVKEVKRGKLQKRALQEVDEPEEMKIKDESDTKTFLSIPPSNSPKDRVHPISYLIKEAEEEWEAVLQRQSQTLFQAVVEYQRRYHRKPPLGFDSWWRYAMENNVLLVDEYDQINEDIQPFFSLPAAEIRARAASLATDRQLPYFAESFTVKVKDGAISASGPNAASSKSDDTQDIMGEFAATLPDMSLTFSNHLLPSVAISGEARKRHLHHADHGTLLSPVQSMEILENKAYPPWQGLCPPNSTARRVTDGLGQAAPGPSFVSISHVPAMDLCHHPEIQSLNGFTAWSGPRPYLLYPLFAWSKTSMHGDLLCPSLEQYFAKGGTAVAWESKSHNQVLWRGESTGTFHQHGSGWRSSQRSRLVLLTSDVEGEREVRFAESKAGDAIRRFRGSTADINEFYFDVAFAGTPTQCNKIDDTCDLIAKELKFLPKMNKDRLNLYKYLLDVDGNGPSGDFRRYLGSGSVVLKSTIFREWWSRRIMPWYHYIPIKTDYSDLHDVAAFFAGTPDGNGAHDDLAKKIGENGKKWAKDHWRETDMAAYQFRLYLEYARLISREEEGSHDFVME